MSEIPTHMPKVLPVTSCHSLNERRNVRQQLMDRVRKAIDDFTEVEPASYFEIMGTLEVLKMEYFYKCQNDQDEEEETDV